MNTAELEKNAQALVAKGKGILAADESTGTCTRRFTGVGVESIEENRRLYRQMLFTAEGMESCVSGVILYDETLRQKDDSGTTFPELLSSKGVIPGIKVDMGSKPLAGFPGEQTTEGLTGLRERVKEYYDLGARFAKWRAVINHGDGLPTAFAIEANALGLARYAALCQEGGLVPIVEPEILMDGTHDLARSYEVTCNVLRTTFDALHRHRVHFEGILLKPSMVISGKDNANRADVQAVAEATVRCLKAHVPATVPGIVFLSGGQNPQEASAHLDAMNRLGGLPWALSFSYGRALQEPALAAWAKDITSAEQTKVAQRAFMHRAKLNSAAATGTYTAAMESEG